MAVLVPNSFTTWDLTEEEFKQGSMLTITQAQVIQNQITELAETKLALEVPADNYSLFLQIEAKLAGQIESLKYLLAQSEYFRLEALAARE